MPFFSFSFNKVIEMNKINKFSPRLINNISKLQAKRKYFSKNTKLWKFFNQKEFKKNFINLQFEKRPLVNKIGKKILFCLPPSIGLGDAIEYALAIQAINNTKLFLYVGVAFVGKYGEIFRNLFQIKNIFYEFIDEDAMKYYDTKFHVSNEIKSLKNQKYERADIEELLTSYFKVKKIRNNKFKNEIVKKITIFPISKSPIRSMSINILNTIIQNHIDDYKIEVVLDNDSIISKHLESNIIKKRITKIYPSSLNSLIEFIKSINFGIFMDSGPLHLAKILSKNGILISNSVNSSILLNNFFTIKVFKSEYKSFYCSSPCGLTNIFNYNNKIGCFDSLQVEKGLILKLPNFNSLQRFDINDNYINFIDNPVGCLKHINTLKLNKFIKKTIQKLECVEH